MIKFTKEEWAKKQYKDTFLDFHGDSPELKGKRTTIQMGEKGTELLIESVHFEIVE